jgi:excisionase family DNA binding protein
MPADNTDNPASTKETFMSVKQVAAYLHLNEKKIYALVNDGCIPATKITGKWMFPRELVDRWMYNSAHGGLLTDRLIIAGSDDPLLYRIILQFAHQSGNHALISYTPTGTRLGLDLLQSNRVDVCALHWGPDEESHLRHPALLRQYSQFKQWVLIHAFRREQGLMIKSSMKHKIKQIDALFTPRYRWVLRQNGSGSHRFLLEVLSKHSLDFEFLNTDCIAFSEREAAAEIAMDQADVSAGSRSAAVEYGLEFIPFGWESFDLALPRSIWFRRLFQNLINRLKSRSCHSMTEKLPGYDLNKAGELVWGDD